MTVKELRKQLIGKPNDMLIYLANHDHSEWETDGKVQSIEVLNQNDYKDQLKDDSSQPKIEGDYLLIRS